MSIVPEVLWAAMEGGYALGKSAVRLRDADTLTKILAGSTAIGAVYYSAILLSDLHRHGQTPKLAPCADNEPHYWRNLIGAGASAAGFVGAVQLAESGVLKNRGH